MRLLHLNSLQDSIQRTLLQEQMEVRWQILTAVRHQLKPQDYAAIKALEVGQISAPIESLDNEGRNGNTVYKIIKVDKIIPAHTATFQNDYDLLLQQAKSQMSMTAINKFIDSKIKTTYIVIDPLFSDCQFERTGWAEKFRKQ